MNQKISSQLPLGKRLLEEGIITQQQLEIATKYQQKIGGKLGYLLYKFGFIKAEKLAQILAEEFNLPYLKYEEINIDTELINKIPRALMEKRLFFPLSHSDKEITLAVSDPTDYDIIDMIGFHEDKEIKIVVVSIKDAEKVITDYFYRNKLPDGSYIKDSLKKEKPSTAQDSKLYTKLQNIPTRELLEVLIKILEEKGIINYEMITKGLEED